MADEVINNQMSAAAPDSQPPVFEEVPYHDPQTFEGIMRALDNEVLGFDDVERAFWFRTFWLLHVGKHAGCREQYPEQYKKYMHAATVAAFVSFNRISEDEQIEMVRGHLLTMFEIPSYSFRRKIEIRLLTFPLLPDRDILRNKLKEAMMANIEVMGVNPQDAAKRLTVSGMIKKYIASKSQAAPGDELSRQRFLNQDSELSVFPPEVREKSRVIIELFDWLSLSSASEEGFEEHFSIVQDGRRMIIRNGRVEDLVDEETKKTVEAMIHAGAKAGLWNEEEMYRQPPLLEPDEIDKVLEEERDFTTTPPWERGRVLERDLEKSRRAAENLKKLEKEYQKWLKSATVARYCHPLSSSADAFEVLYEGINKRDADLVIPAFISMASSGRMHQQFNSQDRYHVYWGKRVQEYRKEMFDAFEVSPGGVLFTAPFIRHILTERLKIEERDALMVGVMLSNLARTTGEEEYATMAYGDLNEGIFKWNDEIVMFG